MMESREARTVDVFLDTRQQSVFDTFTCSHKFFTCNTNTLHTRTSVGLLVAVEQMRTVTVARLFFL